MFILGLNLFKKKKNACFKIINDVFILKLLPRSPTRRGGYLALAIQDANVAASSIYLVR